MREGWISNLGGAPKWPQLTEKECLKGQVVHLGDRVPGQGRTVEKVFVVWSGRSEFGFWKCYLFAGGLS